MFFSPCVVMSHNHMLLFQVVVNVQFTNSPQERSGVVGLCIFFLNFEEGRPELFTCKQSAAN